MNAVVEIENEALVGTKAGGDQYLTFILGEEEYGLDILRVQEIRGWHKTTPIPNTPDFVKGVINLRGNIIPIVDLRKKFDMKVIEYTPITVVIVVKVTNDDRERIVGVVVDAVSEVYNFQEEEIKATPELGSNIDVNYMRGIASVEDKMIMLLDIDHLLSPDELGSNID